MRRSAVDVKVVLLDIFAMVPLAVGKPEQAFLQDGIPFVPQRQRKAQPLFVIADSGESVFAPLVCSRPGLVMGEIVPGISILAVVFADRAPLPFAKVWSPFFPRNACLPRFVQPLLFCYVFNFLVSIQSSRLPSEMLALMKLAHFLAPYSS